MAQPVFLKLKSDGNDIWGESSVSTLDRENTIECHSFYCGVEVPIEATTGFPTGRRIFDPVRFQKHIDKSTPLIIKALSKNEAIQAEFMFFRRGLGGNEEHFYTVRLNNGRVVSVKQVSEDRLIGGDGVLPMMEEIAISFETITWTYENGGVETHDRMRLEC
jgi:type VI secretion system secreted protein Hcp